MLAVEQALERAADARALAVVRLRAAGRDPDPCADLLDALARGVAHVEAAEREPERQRWLAYLTEVVATLDREPNGRAPRPGLTRLDLSRALRSS